MMGNGMKMNALELRKQAARQDDPRSQLCAVTATSTVIPRKSPGLPR